LCQIAEKASCARAAVNALLLMTPLALVGCSVLLWTAAPRSPTHMSALNAQPLHTPSPLCLLPPLPGQGLTAGADGIPVDISVTGINSRCISAQIVVQAAPDVVWRILTDYDRLATHVPNLVVSERRPHPTNGIRVFQEGAQKIIGFDFRASLTMDMFELTEEGRRDPSRVKFVLVESAMFATFEGEWRVLPYSRTRSKADPRKYDYTSKLIYRVNITPKGIVPVPALEWRIREDVPVNLLAVKAAAEKLKQRESL